MKRRRKEIWVLQLEGGGRAVDGVHNGKARCLRMPEVATQNGRRVGVAKREWKGRSKPATASGRKIPLTYWGKKEGRREQVKKGRGGKEIK